MAHFKRPEQPLPGFDGTSASLKQHAVKFGDKMDSIMGFDRFDSGKPREGWLVNFQPTTIDLLSEDTPQGKSAVDFYFLDHDGGYFKSTIQFDPYFYIHCHGREEEVNDFVRKKLGNTLKSSEIVTKEDLSLPNHLLGRKTTLIILKFWCVADLLSARKTLSPIVTANSKRAGDIDAEMLEFMDVQECIHDFREHDVPYHVRVVIDMNVRVGKWYKVSPAPPGTSVTNNVELTELDNEERPDPVVMAFDIETTKLPLKFPDSKYDQVMMISYMIDGNGFLITNREIVSEDIEDFEYTPKPEFPGQFTIFNEANEKDLLMRFFDHIRDEKPTVIATFNGDGFDWPFVCARAAVHGIDMKEEIGFAIDSENEFKSNHCVHMDCYRWVKRDSYLPQGSQGLKAVTTAKLGYTPLEIDPELMTPYATQKPQVLAEYSVSDAVATYYLYMKYVHPFIFSLCTIIPLRPDEVLRKGTGTLCEMLLMVQAYVRNILLPHKHADPPERYFEGHLVESETYVGGHVESLEAGVFRADIPTNFTVDIETVDQLISQLDAALTFTIVTELKLDLKDVTNYAAVKEKILGMLNELKTNPKRLEEPLIYHVDVASMYPNIMTSNRLQPDSMKSERDCAMCDFNTPDKTCDRRLPWAWRGEYYPAKKDEILTIQKQLREERFPLAEGQTQGPDGKPWRYFDNLTKTEQLALQKQRISDYSRKVYHRLRESTTLRKEAIICQRENPFYVNTVRDFRDRRYDFKGLQKKWKQNAGKAKTAEEKEYAAKMVVLYDSLQLAHKVILNSFYGYVMRKGSRWYSMEMAGVTCLTGATIIQLARGMVERLGRPLELDTDGIWCILPKSFPGDLEFELSNGKKIPFAYPCVMLNHLVHEKFTNHQYQTLVDEKNLIWETSSDNTIFFEVDGPYKAMMLPSSREEGKGLKKRYAVFNFDGSLAELKGFELKRRGELQLIKTFQAQLFSQFLKGNNLQECYAAVAKIANSWLDVLDSKGKMLEDVDLMNLISENKSMTKSLDEYGGLKSASISTARRLGDFLGREMVKDKGLACKFIISSEPSHEPVTNRAIPVQIFEAPRAKQEEFLRKWLKKPHLDDFDPRSIIDWKYYRERLAATIQKLIVIPAARQNIPNPVPRVPPPQWLLKKLANEADGMKQQTINFAKIDKSDASRANPSDNTLVDDKSSSEGDIEELPGSVSFDNNGVKKAVVKKRKANSLTDPKKGKDEEEFRVENAPSPDTDYVKWLQYMKNVWAKQREQRESRRQLFGGSARRVRGIQGLLRQQTESAWRGGGGTWQLLQVAPTSDAGKLRAVALVNSRLQTVNLLVKREVYILLRDKHLLPPLDEGIDAEHVPDMLMPSSHTSPNLWKLSMSESKYQDELVRAGGIFKSRSIEKVFESNVDAVDRVLLKLGRYCELSSEMGLLGKGLDSGFELEWLLPVDPALVAGDRKSSKEKEAITADYSTWQFLDYLFVQHYEVHGRHILVILTTWTNEIHVMDLVPRKVASASDTDWSQYLPAEYSSQLSYHHPEQEFFNFPESLNIANSSSERFETASRFWSTANRKISTLLSEKLRSAVTVISCDRGLNWLSSHLRALTESPALSLGNSSNTSALPSIAWEVQLARRVAKTFLRSQYALDTMRVSANHSNIPICNLPSGDDMRHVIDVIYARKLQQNKHILWWKDATDSSPVAYPLDTSSSYQDLVVPANSKVISGSEGKKIGNLYPNVCFDMSISNLVVNTILTSTYLQLAEGSDQADPDFVVGAFSPTAWKCLVSLTKEWWSKASAGNVTADICIQQLAGWVSSPYSRLWSPSLSHQIATLSKYALSQLLRELKKLGTRVVYCEREGQRIVLSTTKKNAVNAVPFGGLLVKEAKNKDMFTYLDISVNDVWDFLIWMDPANYGGRLLGVDDNLEYVASWHIAEILPTILYNEFEECVSEFMALIGECKDKYIGDSSNNGASAPSHVTGIPEDFMDGAFAQFERRLLNRVRQLHNRRLDLLSRKEHDTTFEMPSRAGSQYGKGVQSRESPVLSFVKTLLSVYALARDDASFINLRRTLLSLLDVGDFDSLSQFKNPSAKLVIPNVICVGCMTCVDVDVCRPEPVDSRRFVFVCPRCSVELDRVMLEEMLVQMLVNTITQYQVQDLRCSKCGKIRPSDMAEYCPCSGQFVNSISQTTVLGDLEVYRQVGKYYDLRLINDLLAQC